MSSSRQIKRRLLVCLADGHAAALAESRRYPARIVISPLISFFYHQKEEYRWFAISITGRVVARLAEENMESARVIMRRLMWNLNDESGGIGWGSPEAMGDIICRSKRMAAEYAAVMASYITPGGNFLEHEMLQRGVLWGIGRAARSGRQAIYDTAVHVSSFLFSEDPHHRGLAAWACGFLNAVEAVPRLEELATDENIIPIYRSEKLQAQTVAELACEARLALTASP